ncbi:MAG: putative NEK protein kinase, partial [Streblomastix strix]
SVHKAPELMNGNTNSDPKANIYSVGDVIYQLAGHEYPIKVNSIPDLMKLMQLQTIKRPSSIQDNLLWDLLTHLLDFDPTKRFTAEQALQHPYFTNPQAQLEISAEAKQVAASALQAQLNGDTSITYYDINPSYTIVGNEIKTSFGYDPLIELQPIYQQIQLNQQQPIVQQIQYIPPPMNILPQQQPFNPHFIPVQPPLSQINREFVLPGEIIKIKKIGRGRFGTVSSYQEIRTQRIVAIKECDYDTDELRSMINREIEVMKEFIRIIRQSVHQSQFIHVVEPLGFFVNEDEEKAYLVMELCSEGDLRSYIKNMRKQGTEIGAKKCWEFVSSIITAVNQLHVNDIIHGDLKPENVLLTEDIKVKLADFGLSRKLQQGKEYMTHLGGTTFYLPPELLQIQSVQTDAEGRQLQKRQQTKAADIWAIGIMLYELLAQHHPFIGNDDESADLSELDVAHLIVTEEAPELPAHYPDSLRKIHLGAFQQKKSFPFLKQQLIWEDNEEANL